MRSRRLGTSCSPAGAGSGALSTTVGRTGSAWSSRSMPARVLETVTTASASSTNSACWPTTIARRSRPRSPPEPRAAVDATCSCASSTHRTGRSGWAAVRTAALRAASAMVCRSCACSSCGSNASTTGAIASSRSCTHGSSSRQAPLRHGSGRCPAARSRSARRARAERISGRSSRRGSRSGPPPAPSTDGTGTRTTSAPPRVLRCSSPSGLRPTTSTCHPASAAARAIRCTRESPWTPLATSTASRRARHARPLARALTRAPGTPRRAPRRRAPTTARRAPRARRR